MTQPHIALLREDNARQGFFEPEHLRDVLKHLPEELRPVVKFAYITGMMMDAVAAYLEDGETLSDGDRRLARALLRREL